MHRPRTQRAGADLDHDEERKSDPEGREQAAVGALKHTIDHPLHEERREQREHFQRQRQREDLRQRAPQPGDTPEHLAQAQRLALDAAPEVGLRHQLEHDPGEVARRGYHYRWQDGAWRDTRGGEEFFAALSAQASAQAGRPLDFGAAPV